MKLLLVRSGKKYCKINNFVLMMDMYCSLLKHLRYVKVSCMIFFRGNKVRVFVIVARYIQGREHHLETTMQGYPH